MDVATFRTGFPQFADTTAYPDAQVNFWIGVASNLILQCVWGDLLPYATELFMAHNLALGRQAMIAASGGQVPGINIGVMQSKQIDKLSITYNSNNGIIKDEGHWNLTIWGVMFIQLANLAGMGGYQAGAGPAYAGPGTVWGGTYSGGWPYGGAFGGTYP